jgi:N-acetylneuraminic acid mutarotase
MFGETGASTMVNDIWNSSDGSAWTEQTIAGTPVKRGAMGYAVYNDKVWIVGGIPNGAPGYFYGNVVSFDGTSWATVLDNGHGQFQPRRRHSIVPFNPGSGEVLWLYAGNDGVTGSGGYTNNQYSANTAATIWTAQAAPSWSAREQQAMTAFNNQLWLLGGNDGSNKLNDCLFSSNGTTWTVATTPGNLARTGARLVSHNNRLYAFGGAGTSGALKDLWSTTDGTTWKEVTQLPITARSDFGMVSFNGKLWIIGGKDAAGNYLKDIWTYTEP